MSIAAELSRSLNIIPKHLVYLFLFVFFTKSLKCYNVLSLAYDKFLLDEPTGRITLKSQIAASQETITVFRYELLIRAIDDGACCPGTSPPRLSSTGTVVVNILTDNQYRPVFTSCQSYNPQVNEEQADLFVLKVCLFRAFSITQF